MNARSQAVARRDEEIEASIARAVAAREQEQQRPRTAIEAMASRLLVTPKTLQDTLSKTVFSACRTNEEFVALVVVSNEFGLNPLLKEIYAFPTKGGGIQPMVSIDGWIRLMNEHPQFDGIEFIYHPDEKNGIEAIEAVIYRKDRNHPIKVIEYLEECKRNTDPWNKSPRRMLRHRALIQCVRVAFGFSGIASEDEGDDYVNVTVVDSAPTILPSNKSLAEELDDEIPDFDKDTGEIHETDSRGMTEVDEETARKLDAGETDDDEGEGEQEGDDTPPWEARRSEIADKFANAKTKADLRAADDLLVKHMQGFPGEVQQELEKAGTAARSRLAAQEKAPANA